MSGKFLVFTLALWLAVCWQDGPTRAQSDKAQAPAQASNRQGPASGRSADAPPSLR